MGDVLEFDSGMRDGARDLDELAKACRSNEVSGVAYVLVNKDGSVTTNVFYSDVGQLAMMGAVQVLADEAGEMEEVEDSVDNA